MKKIFVTLLGIAAFVCLNVVNQASAQTTPKTSAQTMTITGTVSVDEKSLVSDKDQKNWTVANPETVKGHGGEHVRVNALLNAASGGLTVKSVKVIALPPPTNDDDKLRIQQPFPRHP